MKALSLEEGLRSAGRRGRSESRRLRPSALWASGLLLVFILVNGTAIAGGVNFCQQTTDHVARSCRAGAQSDYWLALGKCDNLPDADTRKACQQQALADLQDALQT